MQQEGVWIISTDAFTGLRGLAAVWIMIFHCFQLIETPVDLQGSSLMPLFFLLSGFSLTLSYRPIQNSRTSIPFFSFYRNRVARAYPVYLLWNLLSIPLWAFGYGTSPQSSLITSLLISIFLASTALCSVFGENLDLPSWTISTLVFMWLFFPFSASRLYNLSDSDLINKIVTCFWIQLILILVLYFPLVALFGESSFIFFMSTCNPWTRYPVFQMGVYAAELCVRARDRSMEWPAVPFFFPFSFCAQQNSGYCSERGSDEEQMLWARSADAKALFLLLFTLLVAFVDAVYRYASVNHPLLSSNPSIDGAVWLQAINPLAQLTLLVALVRDGGQSLASRFLCHPALQWLGRISMSIYLIHYPVIDYLLWANNRGASVKWPSSSSCGSHQATDADDHCSDEVKIFKQLRTLPIWLIPVIVVVTIVLAVGTFYFVEEPCREAWRYSTMARQIPAVSGTAYVEKQHIIAAVDAVDEPESEGV